MKTGRPQTMLNMKQLIKAIEKHQKAIAKERDSLDKLIDDLQTFRDDCQDAWESLGYAREALSRQV